MRIFKGNFKKTARRFVRNQDMQILETEDFIFERIDVRNINVKFKNIPGLKGYFDIDELRSDKSISIILNTLERDLKKKLFGDKND